MSLYEKYFKKKDTIIYELPRTVTDCTLVEAQQTPRELRTVRGKIAKEDKDYIYIKLEGDNQNRRVGSYLILPISLIRKVIRVNH